MKKVHLLLLLSFAAFAGCNTTPSEEEAATHKMDSLKKEIMAGHDTTMAQMNHMASLRNELKPFKNDTTLGADTMTYKEAYTDLLKASEAMMDWMAQFENPDEMLVEDAEKIAYLEKQKAKVDTLEELTFSSIKRAEELLSSKEK